MIGDLEAYILQKHAEYIAACEGNTNPSSQGFALWLATLPNVYDAATTDFGDGVTPVNA